MKKYNLSVLIITNTYPSQERPGDTPSIKDQVEDLEQLGVSVEVMYIDGSRRMNYILGLSKILPLTFQHKRYDLIHAFYGHTGALAKLQFKYPVITTFLGSDLLAKKDGIIGKFVARVVDGVIVMTEEMKVVSKRPDARVIPFGANTSIFKPYPKAQAREELGLSSNTKFILFPWNPIRPEKRHDLAREVVGLLKRSFDVELITVYNQPRKVIAKYMNASDVMILTSKYEGSPLAVREALACTLPIVSVDVGDVRTLIEETKGGFIASERAEDIAEKITLVLNSEQVLFNLSSNAYDSQYAAGKVLAFYEQILSEHK
jgi:teichuronic acid biosynthesis glycosyltransferase TuaC